MADFSMNILDVIFAVIAAVFLLRGLFRGFVMEVASIGGGVLGFILANKYHELVATHLRSFIDSSNWSLIIAYFAIFFGSMLGVSIVALLIRKLMDSTVGGFGDRLLGGVAGVAKAVLLCCLIVAVSSAFLPDAAFVENSQTAPYLRKVTDLLMRYLPDRMI